MAVSDSQLTSITNPVSSHVNISVESLSGWSDFVETRTGSHYHKPEWREVLQDVMQRELCYLTARDDDGHVTGILPIAITRAPLFGQFGISLPYLNYGGPIGVSDEVETALIDHAFSLVDQLRISHMEIRDTKSRIGLATRTDKVCMILDLRSYDTLDDYLASLPAKVRSQVKKSMRNDMAFQSGSTELLTDFYTVFAHHMRDLGTPVYDRRFFFCHLGNIPE